MAFDFQGKGRVDASVEMDVPSRGAKDTLVKFCARAYAEGRIDNPFLNGCRAMGCTQLRKETCMLGRLGDSRTLNAAGFSSATTVSTTILFSCEGD